MSIIDRLKKNGPARRLHSALAGRLLKNRTPERIFTDIFLRNKWGGDKSVSGRGSDTRQTRIIAAELPRLCSELRISTLLDVPCGDFYWMSGVNLEGVDYLGGDIVEPLIERNRERYEKDNVRFARMNLIADPIPTVDLVFCRDCLVHFSDADVAAALKNICSSGSSYLLTTTFPARNSNVEIATGQWRPLNLERAPFCLPPPLRLIVEECTENAGRYTDKSMGLWNIASIRTALEESAHGDGRRAD